MWNFGYMYIKINKGENPHLLLPLNLSRSLPLSLPLPLSLSAAMDGAPARGRRGAARRWRARRAGDAQVAREARRPRARRAGRARGRLGQRRAATAPGDARGGSRGRAAASAAPRRRSEETTADRPWAVAMGGGTRGMRSGRRSTFKGEGVDFDFQE